MTLVVGPDDLELALERGEVGLDTGPFHGSPLGIDDGPTQRHAAIEPNRSDDLRTCLFAWLEDERLRFARANPSFATTTWTFVGLPSAYRRGMEPM